MAEISIGLETFSERAKSIMILKSRKTINQLEITQEPKSSKPTKLEKNKSVQQEEPTNAAPAPMAPFSNALESPLSLDKKGIKMNEIFELFKQVQINLFLLNTIK